MTAVSHPGDVRVVIPAPVNATAPAASLRRLAPKWRSRAIQAASVLAAVGIWQLLTAGHVRLWLCFDTLPTVTQIGAKFVERVGTSQYWLDLTQSVVRIVSGFY